MKTIPMGEDWAAGAIQAVIEGKDPSEVVSTLYGPRQGRFEEVSAGGKGMEEAKNRYKDRIKALPTWVKIKEIVQKGRKMFQLIRTDLPPKSPRTPILGLFTNREAAVDRAWRWYGEVTTYAVSR